MEHSFDHILNKPWMKGPLSGLTNAFDTASNAAVFTSDVARSAVPDWMNTNPVTGAAITAKHWTESIGVTSCVEQITGSMAYLTQPAVSHILPSLSATTLATGAVNGMNSVLDVKPTEYGIAGIADQVKLNSGGLSAFTAGSAALMGHDTVMPYIRTAASDAVMHDYISVTPKTSQYPLSYGIAAQTGFLHGNLNLHGDTSFASSKYGSVGSVMQDAISVNTKATLGHSYLYGITDPTTLIRSSSDVYTSSLLTGSNGYMHTLNRAGSIHGSNAWKVNTKYDLGVTALSYMATGAKDYAHTFGATGAVVDSNAWKVNTHHDLYPASFRVTTEPNYLTTLGSGAVYANSLHNTNLHSLEYGISAALKANQWHSGTAVASALTVNTPYALSVNGTLKSLSIPLGAAGIYGAGGSLSAAITTDAYKMVTGADAIWKNGALSFGSEGWRAKNIGIYHDYHYPSRSQEIILPSYSEPTITEEVEIRYTLKARLSVLNTSLAVSYQGAAEALNDRRTDHIRHACISMRQLLDFFVNELFTVEEFRQWSGYSEDLLRLNWKGEVIGVQRKAAYQFVTRMLASAPAPKKFLELVEKCNGGCHRFDENYSFSETVALFHKCEAMLEVLLNATDAVSN